MDDKYKAALIDLLDSCFDTRVDGTHWMYIEGIPAEDYVKPETAALIRELSSNDGEVK
jgi:hypothetical protein